MGAGKSASIAGFWKNRVFFAIAHRKKDFLTFFT